VERSVLNAPWEYPPRLLQATLSIPLAMARQRAADHVSYRPDLRARSREYIDHFAAIDVAVLFVNGALVVHNDRSVRSSPNIKYSNLL